MENKYLEEVFNRFSIYLFIKNKHHLVINSEIDDIMKIQQNKEHQIIFISEYLEIASKYNFKSNFFIICFENTLIFIEQTEINQFYQFLLQYRKSPIYVLSENIRRIKTFFEETMNLYLKIEDVKENHFYREEIRSFSHKFHLRMNKKTIISFKPIENLYKIIIESISGYLIQKAYYKSIVYDRINNFKDYAGEINDDTFEEDDTITLRSLSKECTNDINLIYHIRYEKLFVLKIFLDEKGEVLFERECSNYKQINFPLFPKYIGTQQYYSYKCIVIEYIHGNLLKNIHQMKIDDNIKIKIIFQIMIALQYLHYHGFIYRDLKPNNIIFNDKGSIILIDFDRMISDSQDYQFTIDFQHDFIAPEVISGSSFSNKSDIYSLSKMIVFIFTDQFLQDNLQLKNMYDKCTLIDYKKRPDISQLINSFYFDFFAKISFIDETDTIKNDHNIHNIISYNFWFFISEYDNYIAHYYLGQFYIDTSPYNNSKKIIQYLTSSANHNNSDAQYELGVLYYEGKYIPKDINKSIYFFSLAANQNDSDAQFNLGLLYQKGDHIPKNINKAINYYSLAANQNNSNAQLNLGLIYFTGNDISQDINKAIYYLSLAANQNKSEAQYILGKIYLSENNNIFDINKAIYFFTLAADQNNSNAQYKLGLLYFNGVYITRDINKAVYYFSLAADLNDSYAQYNLGLIYYKGDYITRDINKSIHYFTLSANQNNLKAQYNLGIIYEKSEFVERDIDKSIYYYSLAADQNDQNAQFNLGVLYYNDKYIQRDINKSIHYYTLSANQNNLKALFNLGLIYEDGLYIPRNINKSIHYYSLAANQNDSNSQLNLGLIYYNGKYIQRDIDKSIHYFSLAAKQNDSNAQFNLGLIYECGKYIPRDIHKSIYYYSLAANQNNSNARYNLGLIYYKGEYIQQDIKKAIHYFSLSSNSFAEYNLGLIYLKGENVPQDIKKSIHYFTLSAKHGNSYAQYILGLIYYIGEYATRDINKSIHYFMISAKQNNCDALLFLGILYLNGEYLKKDINKSINYLKIAANNNNELANFCLGNLYCKGQDVDQNIDKSISYYKKCSSFNHQYSKNNLGILMKKFKRNEIAIEYFEEAIRQKDDIIAMYNLGHIYFYGDLVKKNIDKSIELFIKSANQNFYPSKISPVNIQTISKVTTKYGNNNIELNQEILMIISKNKLIDEFHYEKEYSYYKNIEFMYDSNKEALEYLFFIQKEKRSRKFQSENLKESFYEGFKINVL